MPDTQTLKARIIALLDFLPTDSLAVLAEFAAFLQTKADSPVKIEDATPPKEKASVQLELTSESRQRPIRITSPRLVHREQIADFKLEVIEEAPNDRL